MPYFKSNQNANPGPSIAAAIASRYSNKVRAASAGNGNDKKKQQQQQSKYNFKYSPPKDDFVFYYPKAPSFEGQIAQEEKMANNKTMNEAVQYYKERTSAKSSKGREGSHVPPADLLSSPTSPPSSKKNTAPGVSSPTATSAAAAAAGGGNQQQQEEGTSQPCVKEALLQQPQAVAPFAVNDARGSVHSPLGNNVNNRNKNDENDNNNKKKDTESEYQRSYGHHHQHEDQQHCHHHHHDNHNLAPGYYAHHQEQPGVKKHIQGNIPHRVPANREVELILQRGGYTDQRSKAYSYSAGRNQSYNNNNNQGGGGALPLNQYAKNNGNASWEKHYAKHQPQVVLKVPVPDQSEKQHQNLLKTHHHTSVPPTKKSLQQQRDLQLAAQHALQGAHQQQQHHHHQHHEEGEEDDDHNVELQNQSEFVTTAGNRANNNKKQQDFFPRPKSAGDIRDTAVPASGFVSPNVNLYQDAVIHQKYKENIQKNREREMERRKELGFAGIKGGRGNNSVTSRSRSNSAARGGEDNNHYQQSKRASSLGSHQARFHDHCVPQKQQQQQQQQQNRKHRAASAGGIVQRQQQQEQSQGQSQQHQEAQPQARRAPPPQETAQPPAPCKCVCHDLAHHNEESEKNRMTVSTKRHLQAAAPNFQTPSSSTHTGVGGCIDWPTSLLSDHKRKLFADGGYTPQRFHQNQQQQQTQKPQQNQAQK